MSLAEDMQQIRDQLDELYAQHGDVEEKISDLWDKLSKLDKRQVSDLGFLQSLTWEPNLDVEFFKKNSTESGEIFFADLKHNFSDVDPVELDAHVFVRISEGRLSLYGRFWNVCNWARWYGLEISLEEYDYYIDYHLTKAAQLDDVKQYILSLKGEKN